MENELINNVKIIIKESRKNIDRSNDSYNIIQSKINTKEIYDMSRNEVIELLKIMNVLNNALTTNLSGSLQVIEGLLNISTGEEI